MSTIDRQVGRAHRRLNTNQFLAWCTTGLGVAAALAAASILIERAFVFGVPERVLLLTALAAGVAVALVGTLMHWVDRVSAAVAVDLAAGTRERISTAVVMRGDADPFARAVIVDAERIATGMRIGAHLPLRAPQSWPWSAGGLAMAAIIYAFMPQLHLLAGDDAPDESASTEALAATQAVVVQTNAELNRVRKLAEENPRLADLARDIEPVDIPEDPALKPDDIRREVVKKIDSVQEKLQKEEQSQQLNSLKELQRELARLDPKKGDDAASKFAEALANGDMKVAREKLEELRKQLAQAAAKGDEQARKALAEMSEKLDDLVKQLEKLADKSALRKELENKAGLSEEDAKKLLEKLAQMNPDDLQKLQQALAQQLQNSGLTQEQIKQLAQKMAQQLKAQQQCQSLAQCMAQAAQAMSACASGAMAQSQNADAAMMQAGAMLSDLEMAEATLADIQAAMAQLKALREGACKGGNCQSDQFSNRIGSQGPNAGLGYGSRIGRERGAHKYEASKAPVKLTGGQIIGQMLIDGPQIKGEASAEVRDAVTSAVRDATDAIDRQAVPTQYQPTVRTYFDALAGLLQRSGGQLPPPAAAPGQPAPAAGGSGNSGGAGGSDK